MAGEVAALGALLDGLAPSAGAVTIPFTYVRYGRHLDINAQPATGGLVTVQPLWNTARSTDTGGGAERITPRLDCHFWYEDEADLDNDAFLDALEVAVRDVVRSNARSIGDAYWAVAQNIQHLLEQRGEGATLNVHHAIVSVDLQIAETFPQ